MDRIEEICDKIGQCDDNIIEQLVARMRCIQDIIEYKKEKGIPILNNNMNVEFISQLLEKRRALYEEAADITVATDGKSVSEICDEIVSELIAYDLRLNKKES